MRRFWKIWKHCSAGKRLYWSCFFLLLLLAVGYLTLICAKGIRNYSRGCIVSPLRFTIHPRWLLTFPSDIERRYFSTDVYDPDCETFWDKLYLDSPSEPAASFLKMDRTLHYREREEERLEIIRAAERSEPDNAYFCYRKANDLLPVVLYEDGEPVYENREEFENAISIWLEGTRKPFYRTYTGSHADRLLKILPLDGTYSRVLERQILRCSIIWEWFPIRYSFLESLAGYLKHLRSMGRDSEIQELCDGLRRMMIHQLSDAEMFMDFNGCRMNAQRIMVLMAPEIDRPENGELKKMLTEITDFFQESRNAAKRRQYDWENNFRSRSGFMMDIVLAPNRGFPTELEMKVSRTYELLQFQNITILVMAGICFLVGIFTIHKTAFKILSLREITLVFCAVLLPYLIGYVLLPAFSPAFRGNIAYNPLGIAVHVWFFLAILFILDRRLSNGNLAARINAIFFITFALLPLYFYCFPMLMTASVLYEVCLAGLVILLCMGAGTIITKAKPQDGRRIIFQIILGKGQAEPTADSRICFAICILLMLVVMPIQIWREADCVRQDTFLAHGSENTIDEPLTQRTIKPLREKIDAILERK